MCGLGVTKVMFLSGVRTKHLVDTVQVRYGDKNGQYKLILCVRVWVYREQRRPYSMLRFQI